ncbi:unnamed protein product, partial [Cladocopium goreaui]
MDADLRCQVEVIFQSTLADTNGLLERESCIDFLQSIGGTKQEANALLKEYDQQEPHISVKDFLDILCGPEKKAPAEATETAGNVKEVPQPVEPLKEEPTVEAVEEHGVDPAPVESQTEAEPVELPKEEEPLEITATTAGTAEVTEVQDDSAPERTCDMCGTKTEVTQDPTDLGWYCEPC